MKKRLVTASSVLFFVLASFGAAQEEAYDPEAAITLTTNADPTFNPWYPGVGIESDLINEMIFDGLTRWDENMQVSPRLATSWEVSDDGLTWTFELRENVLWHDGEVFDAEDVAFTFNEIVLNSELGATNANIYAPIDRVEIVDSYTVEFLMNEPFSSLPEYLTYYEGILPEHIFAGVEDPWSLSSFNKEGPIGTGAFRFEAYQSGAFVRLVRNPDYWDGEPKIREVTFQVVPDPDAQIAQMLAGNLDLISIENPTLLSRLQSRPGLAFDSQSENVYYFVILHQTDPRFQDVRVRQGLLHAIDRQAIIDSVLEGYGSVATGPIAPIQQEFYTDEVDQYPYDPERARELLAEAGWTPGSDGILQKDGERLTITIDQGEFGQLVPIAVLVQQYWQDVGVEVNLNVMDWNSYLTKTYVNRDYEATVCWWRTPATPDVSPYYHSEAAGSGNNWPDYKDPELDKLLTAELAATSLEEKKQYAIEIQEYVAEQLPYLYLYYPEGTVVRNEKLQGLIASNLPAAYQHSAEWYVAQ